MTLLAFKQKIVPHFSQMAFFDPSFHVRLFVMDHRETGSALYKQTYKKTCVRTKILKLFFKKFNITSFDLYFIFIWDTHHRYQ